MKKVILSITFAMLLISCKDSNAPQINNSVENKVLKEEKVTTGENITYKNNIDCYSDTKITDLPITKSTIDANGIWNQLNCNIADLETKDYLRLPNIKDVKVFVMGNFNYDDVFYTLVTIKDDKVVLKKDIGFASTDEQNLVSEITEFEISDDFVFFVTTKVKENEVFKINKVEKFVINENGEIFIKE